MATTSYPSCPKCGRSLEMMLKNRLPHCGRCGADVSPVIAEWRRYQEQTARLVEAQADPLAVLLNAKRMLDEGLISAEDYEGIKRRTLEGQSAPPSAADPSGGG